jgi:hypothetical protein
MHQAVAGVPGLETCTRLLECWRYVGDQKLHWQLSGWPGPAAGPVIMANPREVGGRRRARAARHVQVSTIEDSGKNF